MESTKAALYVLLLVALSLSVLQGESTGDSRNIKKRSEGIHGKPFTLVGAVKAYTEESEIDSSISGLPYFEFNVPRNVTTTVGQTAFLHCRVQQLGDKAVSWIRKRDLHILTAGILTYTSDQRFQVIRPDKSDNWTLQIKFPQLRDSGIYECQVNTEPKMSLAYRLNVVEARARILGPGDLHVKAGSSVTITCTINQGPHDLGTISWYRDTEILKSNSPTSNEADSIPRLSIENNWVDGLTSRLHISNVRLSDSGNYSCVPTLATPASVNIHVINGEHPAAMQHGNKNTAPLSLSLHCALVYSFTIFIIKHIR
ncbi:zwei Ig domain protein zig-8 isoform X2 [Agrilus planipennis]|uniref:Zwei Ig domain protein zig-8 isoform X2 n=1 Tax=Agrilus planipennis TaxID=224129 RepID=A0A1W4WKQ1_AGRPL|nr:zwei Ig domain protein zig-8 isoform X2 [Agrilus planipennis]